MSAPLVSGFHMHAVSHSHLIPPVLSPQRLHISFPAIPDRLTEDGQTFVPSGCRRALCSTRRRQLIQSESGKARLTQALASTTYTFPTTPGNNSREWLARSGRDADPGRLADEECSKDHSEVDTPLPTRRATTPSAALHSIPPNTVSPTLLAVTNTPGDDASTAIAARSTVSRPK